MEEAEALCLQKDAELDIACKVKRIKKLAGRICSPFYPKGLEQNSTASLQRGLLLGNSSFMSLHKWTSLSVLRLSRM